MREWLTVIIVLLIIGIVLDGIRRVRAARKERIHMAKSLPEADDFPEFESAGSQFPTGGARVAGYRHPDDASSLNDALKANVAEIKITQGVGQSHQAVGQSHQAPVLMEAADDLIEPDAFEPTVGHLNLDDLDEDTAVATAEVAHVTASPKTQPAKPLVRKKARVVSPRKSTENPEPTKKPAEQLEPLEPEEVIVINVMAHEGCVFVGEELAAAFQQQNLRYGTMDIFHRHKNTDGSGEVLFSVANMVKPGTFDMNHLAEFETPGISLFMTLPLHGDSVAAFGLMARTAKVIAEVLQGELKDEQRSVMTSQTFEHYRQRVLEFERRRRLNR